MRVRGCSCHVGLSVPLPAELAQGSAAIERLLKVEASRECRLIGGLAIYATCDALAQPAFGVPRRFGVDAIRGIEGEAAMPVQRLSGGDEPGLEFSLREYN